MIITLENVTSQQLLRAASLKERMEVLQKELDQIIGGYTSRTPGEGRLPQKAKKRFTASARRKMAAAQKARWAKIRGESSGDGDAPPKAKQGMSPATKA